jgi:IS6 family transposase
LRFSLSYRDVEELLAERGLLVDHVTVWRWVQSYAPEIQRRLRPRLRPTNDSWRVDETYIRVKGEWRYLYRAVDSYDAAMDFEDHRCVFITIVLQLRRTLSGVLPEPAN